MTELLCVEGRMAELLWVEGRMLSRRRMLYWSPRPGRGQHCCCYSATRIHSSVFFPHPYSGTSLGLDGMDSLPALGS